VRDHPVEGEVGQPLDVLGLVGLFAVAHAIEEDSHVDQ
jgi:hypothetical protein